jgi:hypothetical protein
VCRGLDGGKDDHSRHATDDQPKPKASGSRPEIVRDCAHRPASYFTSVRTVRKCPNGRTGRSVQVSEVSGGFIDPGHSDAPRQANRRLYGTAARSLTAWGAARRTPPTSPESVAQRAQRRQS